MNELLWLAFALVNFILIVVVYKFFGKTGLIAWIAMGTVLANIQVTKTIEIFTLTATLGNIMYGSLFLITDTLNEKYGLQEAKKAVYIGFTSLIAMVIIMNMVLWFTPHADDFAHGALQTIFGLMPRIAIGSLTAYLISQILDVYLFQKIKEKFSSDKTLYVRNIGSTMVSQFIDTLIFVPIAFIGIHDTKILISIFITTYLVKLIVAMLDTPFVYLMKRITPLAK